MSEAMLALPDLQPIESQEADRPKDQWLKLLPPLPRAGGVASGLGAVGAWILLVTVAYLSFVILCKPEVLITFVGAACRWVPRYFARAATATVAQAETEAAGLASDVASSLASEAAEMITGTTAPTGGQTTPFAWAILAAAVWCLQ